MRWTDRQVAMLREMGVWPWPDAEEASRLPPFGARPAASTVAPSTATTRTGVPGESTRPAGEAAPRPGPAAAAPAPRATPPVAHAPLLRNRPAGVETMGWAELREAAANCTACKLCTGRRQAVFGVGHPRAHWMIVGEAPGEQEDIQGEPFVGKSGQLLDNMLRALGLSRHEAPGAAGPAAMDTAARQVYIANTLKCRPPGNRNPEPDELAQCEPFLVRQIELVQPRIILAMGRFAVQSLLRSNEPIGRLRGRVHRYQGVPLIVTYHPAYLLRNLQDKARAWDDLCLAAETADNPRTVE